MNVTLYGIPNCDTVKKARVWLDDNNIEHRFHDFRKDGLEADQVKQWITTLALDTVINKRSTSWKALTDEQKNGLNEQTAVELILDSPTLIKRPLLDKDGELQVGFKAANYESTFA
ncbi:MAG: ArsC family reductase [Candidatus Pelagadaptatus aseana]|uniref:ArsC family reductase n=1 Tax=Candidatus Pelagadaptatus aseana TaxID=3120508 RepID=UPI0039B2C949